MIPKSRSLSAIVLCGSLLAFVAFVMTYAAGTAAAEGDVISQLLELPAPPPPNPLMPALRPRTEEFYDPDKPPPDDAPIEDLMDYWAHRSGSFNRLGRNTFPSDTVVRRLIGEIQKEPETAVRYLNAFGESPDGARFIKQLYDRSAGDANFDRGSRTMMRNWLTFNSPYFAADLEKRSATVADTDAGYVSGQDELLALARFSWDRAEPVVRRLYNDASQPTSRVLAMWALYKHAIESDSLGDIDRYRGELMKVVEDKSATPGQRDLAFDALVKEKEWNGRDEWYYSLLADETLADLRVNGQSYTGLTTIIMYAPPDRYKAKMIELTKSDNKTVRNAAVRNLLTIERELDEDVARALVPWLSNPAWADLPGVPDGRAAVVRALTQHRLPESVTGLVAMLDEKETAEDRGQRYGPANMAANAANMVLTANTAATNSNTAYATTSNSNRGYSSPREVNYPHRYGAIAALEVQADGRAVSALRRLLSQVEGHERGMVVKALVASGGFSIQEQVAGLEAVAKAAREVEDLVEREFTKMSAGTIGDGLAEFETYVKRSAANIAATAYMSSKHDRLDIQIGSALVGEREPGDELLRALIDRIGVVEKRDPLTAGRMRAIVLAWKGRAVNALLLSDLKTGKATAESIVKLLSLRKELRENQLPDVLDARGGVPVSAATASCILEDENAVEQLLNTNAETAAAAFACARLIRLPIPVETAAQFVGSGDPRLAKAAELYLESEDSPAARGVVLSLHPGEAKVLGATTHFEGTKPGGRPGVFVDELFQTVTYGGGSRLLQDFSAVNERLTGNRSLDENRKELLADPALLGLYLYQEYKISIYADRVTLSVREDESRYRERALTSEDFDQLRQFLVRHNVDSLPPFLGRCEDDCERRELIMVGRSGGRRVFLANEKLPEFFAGLDSYFGGLMRAAPLKLKYAAAAEFPGLEIVLADERFPVDTVWKRGDDLRVLARDAGQRERLRKEHMAAIEGLESDAGEYTEEEDPDPLAGGGEHNDGPPRSYEEIQSSLEKRRFEGVAWYSVDNGELGPVMPAPPEIEFPPAVDGLAVPPSEQRWRATAAGVEIRAGEDGLYRVAQGKLTRIRTGQYSDPVISPDGRWIVANKYTDDYSELLVRINVPTGREFVIDTSGSSASSQVCWVPGVNRFLLRSWDYRRYHDNEDIYDSILESPSDLDSVTFSLLDPTFGTLSPMPGEARPLAQQSFRRLQPAARPNEFWAALPDDAKNQTLVGIYQPAFFNFRAVMRIPKIRFGSMEMWVDEPAGKVYFAYKGHLLAAPLPKPQ